MAVRLAWSAPQRRGHLQRIAAGGVTRSQIGSLPDVAIARSRSLGFSSSRRTPSTRASRRSRRAASAPPTSSSPGGGSTYIGQAAHCSGTGAATDTNGCDAGTLPLGTPVEINGATQPGTLAYSSWITMQKPGRDQPRRVRVQRLRARADRGGRRRQGQRLGARLRRARRGRRGQQHRRRRSTPTATRRCAAGITQLSPKQGTVVQTTGNGWSRTVYTVTPGIPGDSGSGFLDAQGGAIGTLSTVAIAPLAGVERRGGPGPRAQLRRRRMAPRCRW